MNVDLASSNRNSIELVIFDMDGVIFEGHNFWLDMHHAYSTAEQGIELANRLMVSDYGRLASIVAGRLWKGRSSAPFESLVESRSYEPSIPELFHYLEAVNLPTALISSGPQQLAARARSDLGIDIVRANHVHVEDGRITGATTIDVPDAEKVRVAIDVVAHFQTSLAHTAFIGDSESDVQLLELVGVGIAYNATSQALEDVAQYVVQRGELAEVIQILDGYRRPGGGAPLNAYRGE